MNEIEKLLIRSKFGEENINEKYKIFQELKIGIEKLFESYDEKDFDFILNCSRLILDNIENSFRINR